MKERCVQGTLQDPFANAGEHYNRNDECGRLYHTGDLPFLYESEGFAFMIFCTNRFTTDEIVGRTVVIHDILVHPEQGLEEVSGKKLACGQIKYSY